MQPSYTIGRRARRRYCQFFVVAMKSAAGVAIAAMITCSQSTAFAGEAAAGRNDKGVQVGGGGGRSTVEQCTVLQGSTSYKQHNAPTDIMGLFSAIYDRVNEDLDDVVQVEINYVGDVIHRLVGQHDVRATVTRLQQVDGEGASTHEECLVIPVDIQDTNECTLPEGHAMHHECDASTVCVNTIGSYECACPNDEMCIPKSGGGLCSQVSNTSDCCTVDEEKRPHGCRDKTCASECRRDFRCYVDQCKGECVNPDTCTSRRGIVTCKCAPGEVGNGRICPGETPELYTDAQGNIVPTDVDPSTVCGCQVPRRNLCHGVKCGQHSSCSPATGKCECTSEFHDVAGHGCVDPLAPVLKLKGPAELTMKQCEKYVERGVEVIDSNSENDDRKVGVSYSRPPGKCTTDLGTFTVNYTLNTGWTDPAVQHILRQVTVVDVDECSLDPNSAEAQCPSCRVQCHEHAKCENRVGSYTCVCPACMTGDGFEQLMPTKQSKVPMGYVDGTGCVDSCAPVITLLGDNPLIVTVVVSTDLLGRKLPSRNYASELLNLIQATRGGGLCDEGKGSRCAKVLDNNGTHADVDITDRLSIADPVQVSRSPPQFQVSYAATDAAGNIAPSVTRLVEFKELTMDEYAAIKAQEALDRVGGCPECPTVDCGKQRRSAAIAADQRCPPCAEDGGGRDHCSKCACTDRSDCMSRADCWAKKAAWSREAATAVQAKIDAEASKGLACTGDEVCPFAPCIVWFFGVGMVLVLVGGRTCQRPPAIALEPAQGHAPFVAVPAPPSASASSFAASPTRDSATNGGDGIASGSMGGSSIAVSRRGGTRFDDGEEDNDGPIVEDRSRRHADANSRRRW